VSTGDQIALAGFALAIIIAVLTALRQPTFISAGRAAEMQKIIESLRLECEECRRERASDSGRISFLESHVAILMADREFWQAEYRKLKEHPSV
jgi:uncharacterized membrane protein (DUF106 family)